MDTKSRDVIINSSLETQVSFIKQSFGERENGAQALEECAREEAKELLQTLGSTLNREQWSQIEFEMHKCLGRPDYTRKGVRNVSQALASTQDIETPLQKNKICVHLTGEEVEAIFLQGLLRLSSNYLLAVTWTNKQTFARCHTVMQTFSHNRD
jgi:hypothetical protein